MEVMSVEKLNVEDVVERCLLEPRVFVVGEKVFPALGEKPNAVRRDVSYLRFQSAVSSAP